MKDIQVIVKRPGEPAEVTKIPNTLKAFQELVGGYIETVSIRMDIVAIVNEEGRWMNLPRNIRGLVGTIVFAKVNGDEFGSLKDTVAAELMTKIKAWEGHPVCV